MTDLRSDMIHFILTKTPLTFRGKENWLGVKMSPHQSMEFINEITEDGIKTSCSQYAFDECPDEIIATIYQRLKLIESRSTPKDAIE